MQTRLPICVEELVRLSESCRMAERKLLVCEKMIQEAQHEILRCKRMCAIISEDVDIDTEVRLYNNILFIYLFIYYLFIHLF
jgi:hypothetical protein